MHSCIGRSIVDKYFLLIIHDRTVREYYVGYVSDSLLASWSDQKSGRLCDHFGRIIQVCCKSINDITKSCCSISYTMCNVDPAFVRLNRCCTGAILCFCNCVILADAGHLLLIDHCVCDVITETKSNTTSASCINEIVHRTCIERVLSVYKFRMKHNISLLRAAKCL